MSQPVRTAYSKLSEKSQTVLPAELRERLSIVPGDRVRDLFTPDGVHIDKAPAEGEDPFVAFTEWGGPIDDADYADLQPLVPGRHRRRAVSLLGPAGRDATPCRGDLR